MRDVEGLGAAIGRALADPVAERAGAQALRADVLARYDWDDVTDRTLELYARLVGSRGR